MNCRCKTHVTINSILRLIGLINSKFVVIGQLKHALQLTKHKTKTTMKTISATDKELMRKLLILKTPAKSRKVL